MKKKDAIVNCHIPLELGEKVKAYSEKNGLTITAVVTQALQLYLQQQIFVSDMMEKALSNSEYFFKLKSVVESMDEIEKASKSGSNLK